MFSMLLYLAVLFYSLSFAFVAFWRRWGMRYERDKMWRRPEVTPSEEHLAGEAEREAFVFIQGRIDHPPDAAQHVRSDGNGAIGCIQWHLGRLKDIYQHVV